ncbi:hypothetical protein WG947_08945 [Pontibacter sp. H259]|uniref:hypothetical protein n=1 Tax=Pontibacter sp. H259 TaxID=3133421 RepID=UPI0030BCDC65
MILYKDGFLQLDYNPTTDVLYTPCPDIHADELLHLHKAFSIIVETLKSYNIKYFLLDASQSQTTVGEEEYFIVMEQLVQALKETPLLKLARVVSSSTMREHKAAQFMTESKHLFPYAIQNFTSKEAALYWLKNQ